MLHIYSALSINRVFFLRIFHETHPIDRPNFTCNALIRPAFDVCKWHCFEHKHCLDDNPTSVLLLRVQLSGTHSFITGRAVLFCWIVSWCSIWWKFTEDALLSFKMVRDFHFRNFVVNCNQSAIILITVDYPDIQIYIVHIVTRQMSFYHQNILLTLWTIVVTWCSV